MTEDLRRRDPNIEIDADPEIDSLYDPIREGNPFAFTGSPTSNPFAGLVVLVESLRRLRRSRGVADGRAEEIQPELPDTNPQPLP